VVGGSKVGVVGEEGSLERGRRHRSGHESSFLLPPLRSGIIGRRALVCVVIVVIVVVVIVVISERSDR
jgi:hypothetical protein